MEQIMIIYSGPGEYNKAIIDHAELYTVDQLETIQQINAEEGRPDVKITRILVPSITNAMLYPTHCPVCGIVSGYSDAKNSSVNCRKHANELEIQTAKYIENERSAHAKIN